MCSNYNKHVGIARRGPSLVIQTCNLQHDMTWTYVVCVVHTLYFILINIGIHASTSNYSKLLIYLMNFLFYCTEIRVKNLINCFGYLFVHDCKYIYLIYFNTNEVCIRAIESRIGSIFGSFN